MNFEVLLTKDFIKRLKALAKRYHSIKADILEFEQSISKNPFQGVEIAPGVRKIRMAITSKGKGKSAGARIITYTIISSVETGKVVLFDIYDKSDTSSVDSQMIFKLISQFIEENEQI